MPNAKENSITPEKARADAKQQSVPAISLPKGGGAIRGIGEKFGANPVTGTGSMTVPIATSPGRSGFGPQLSIAYDSGSGNGLFGFGWSLSLPAITRKTDKGLPRYRDAEESDVYILSGAEDLVPVLVEANGTWQRETFTSPVWAPAHRVDRYRPRVEGLFARIERWTENATGLIHWRSISKDNITTLYGARPDSRIADPDDPIRVFSWLICESYDDKGNAILYRYKSEDSAGIDFPALTHESNRTPLGRSVNRYLKRIKYGNRTPRQSGEDLTLRDDWLFEVVFDYGEHYTEDAEGQPTSVFLDDQHRSWPLRQDPFSSYRAGFEVRTYRLCRRALMFHHFAAELGTPDCLVRSTEFQYGEGPVASFITAVTQSGFVRRPDDSYRKKSLPPLDFGYTQVEVSSEVREIDPDSLENLPSGLEGAQWVDLDGEGVSGILTEQGDAWYYKPNLGDGRFGPLESVARKPSLANLRAGGQQLLDLAGDGQLDLVALEAPTPGFFERTEDQDWATFVPFRSLPNRAWNDPNLRFVDLTGDGHADVLVTEDDAFAWYASLAEDGFGPAEKTRQALDEEKGPRLVFADGTQSIYLADMSGDGLTDLVRVRNGEVCYWPHRGYCRFGAKVTMDNAPWFDAPDLFDQRRVRLADIDGSGNTDILYLGRDGVRLYFNQSGNRWSDPQQLAAFPQFDNLKDVAVSDLLGNGTSCLVWSSPLPGDAGRPMRYIDLMGGQKPHLLVSVKNNLGAETYVQYAPSTKFYLADKAAGNPWITRLPFPVHVVERVETYDRVSRNYHVTHSTYHHGCFDGVEREFRGFGLVEQTDTEQFAALTAGGTLTDATNIDEASHVPPVLTKTWFHTGAYIEGARISRHFEHQYYREGDESEGVSGLTDEQLETMLLPDTTLPNTIKRPDGTALPWSLSTEEEREACRALKGSVLRREIYALDGSDEEDRPYSATEQNYTIEVLQPQAGQRHAVFFTHPRESVDLHYERKLFKVVGNTLVDPETTPSTAKTVADPRVTHALTLEVDGYGNVLKSAAIGYGRRFEDPQLTIADQQKQTTTLVTYTENDVTNPINDTTNDPDNYRAPLPSETRTYELLNSQPASDEPDITSLYRFDELGDLIAQASDGQHDILYEDVGAAGATGNAPFRRLIERIRTLYRSNTLSDFKPLGELESLALPGESYRLAFTPGLIAKVYQRPLDVVQPQGSPPPENLLPDLALVLGGKAGDQGGYVNLDGDGCWWIPSGRLFYDTTADVANAAATALAELTEAQQHFFLPRKFTDPFGHSSTVAYDPHDLLVMKTEDAAQNTVTTLHDYRVLQPKQMTDPNGNRSEAAFDTLGLVAGTAVMGKPPPALVEGDSLEDFEADLTQAQIDGFYDVDDPHVPAPNLLKGATTRIVYDLDRFRRTQQAHPENPTLWLPACAATLARESHVSDPLPPDGLKIQISFSYSDGFGRGVQTKIQAEPGPVIEGGPVVSPRWVGSGWTIFNNKGKPVRQYEPFFSQLPLKRHWFEFGVQVGVSPILFYDPVERVVATLHPNYTWGKVVFDPWQQTTYDVNDTILNADGSTDPKSDEDVKGFFSRLSDADYLPTWYEQRVGLAANNPERIAADKAAVHHQTPTVADFDTLGRTFLTIAHNRFERNNAIVEEKYPTRVELDIEGNQRAVRDAVVQNGDVQGRIVMRYDYDMLGNRIHQASMEAGERWMLNDVTGKPIRAWDNRGHNFKTEYDSLRRLLRQFVRGTDSTRSDPRTLNADVVFAKIEYGEGQPNDVALNLRTRVFKSYDGAGVVTNIGNNPVTGEDEAYDFKGNLLRSRRQLAADYKAIPDWSASPALEAEVFTSGSAFDALNRPTAVTAPDKSTYRPTYNEANFLDKVEVNLRGTATVTPFVTNIDYNAKGQRTLIHYANGTETTYEYDKRTFRLIHLKTTRAPGQNGLTSQIFKSATTVQDLRYTYDPAGNITRIADDALPIVVHDNQTVSPVCDYTYDAVYRLIGATGREHIDQTALDLASHEGNFRDYPLAGLDAHPNDLQALRNYTEQYEYDAVGNFENLIHHAGPNGSWTRAYDYKKTSLLEFTKQSNLLTGTTIGQTNEIYAHDTHGNMTAMPHLTLMQWDFKDQLRATSRQVDNSGTPETTFYVYDASGQRVRKVTERQTGTRNDERIYLGGFEIYRKYNGNGAEIALERQTLHVMDDKQRIALVETQTVDSASPLGPHSSVIRYQLGNHLGSASLELDDDGGLISYEEYHPYGTTAYQAITSAAEVSLKRYRYTGKERDEETGLYYHGARYYASWLGRWTTTDPLGMVDGANLFAYARAKPVHLTDSSGAQAHPGQGGGQGAGPVGTGALTGMAGLAERAKEAAQVAMKEKIEEERAIADLAVQQAATGERLTPVSYTTPPKQHSASEGSAFRQYSKEESQRSDVFMKSLKIQLEWGEKSRTVPLYGSLTFRIPYGDLSAEQVVAQDQAGEFAGTFGQAVAGVGSGRSYFELAGHEPVAAEVAPYEQAASPAPVTTPKLAAGATQTRIAPSSLPQAPGNKVVAATPGGPVTLSGWGAGSQIPGYENPAVQVYQYRQATGNPASPHFRDLRGAPGSYFSSHAEWQAYVLNPGASSTTVSQIPCLGCQTGFRAEAVRTQRTIQVNAPTEEGPGIWNFTPSGTMWVSPFTPF